MPADENGTLGTSAERIVGLLVIGVILFSCLWIVWPLLSVLAWAALIAIVLSPAHHRLARAAGDRRKLAAAVLVVILLAFFVLPLTLLPLSFERAAKGLAAATSNWTELRLPQPPGWLSGIPMVGSTISGKWSALASDRQALLANVKPYAAPAFQWIAAQSASLGIAVVQILIAIILAGVFLAAEAGATTALHQIAHRLGGMSGENLLDVAVRTVRSVAFGVIGTALIQATLSALSFVIAGVPLAVALGILSFGTAMLQLGTWPVWIPAALWLYYQGETGWALFLTVAGFIINVIDNVIKPLLIGHGAGVPLWVIFIGVISGVLTIGILGIFIGPLIMVAGYSILTTWLRSKALSGPGT